MTGLIVVLSLLGVIGILLVVFRKPIYRSWQAAELARAESTFPPVQGHLRAQFFELAAQRGKPRGLTWIRCDWLDDSVILREPSTGLVTAFDSVNISFEAIEGGEMEDVEAVDTIRDAVAVYHYRQGQWGTGGRALFNMSAQDAREWFLSDLESPLKLL